MIGQIIGALLGGILGLPRAALSLLAGSTIEIDGRRLDLQTQFLLRLLGMVRGRSWSEMTVDEARRDLEESSGLLGASPLQVGSVEDAVIAGPAGDIPIRIYTPTATDRPLPIVVYYHGGGWVLGSLDTHDATCRKLAERAVVVVVSVDYRLAPEHPFPVAVDDAEASYRWARENAARLGGDPARIGVAGDSAGGNLAAVVCQVAKGKGESLPAFQLLIYPVTDLVEEAPSYELFSEGFFLTRAEMRWFRDHYLGSDEAARDSRASPLRSDDLAGLPPALVLTAGFDVLRDEGRAYAEKLEAAGVSVEHRESAGLIHGFFSMGDLIDEARTTFDDAARTLGVTLRK